RAPAPGPGRPRPRAHARARLRPGRGRRRRAGDQRAARRRARRPGRALRRRAPARPPGSPGAPVLMEAADQRTYETATARIEEIIRRLDSGEAGLRETLDLVREGRELVEFCAAELEAVGQGLEELRLEELVARLEAGSRPTETE